MASGFNGQKFKFNGYLPIKENELVKEIRKLEKESLNENLTQIFIETPYRNQKLLNTLMRTCNSNTELSVSRDLQGESQFIKTASIKKWRELNMGLDKTPCVFLLKA